MKQKKGIRMWLLGWFVYLVFLISIFLTDYSRRMVDGNVSTYSPEPHLVFMDIINIMIFLVFVCFLAWAEFRSLYAVWVRIIRLLGQITLGLTLLFFAGIYYISFIGAIY